MIALIGGLAWDGVRSGWAASAYSGSEGDSPIYRFVRAVFEGVALLVIMIVIEILFLGPGTYATLDVHPFWIAVLLVSVQHGLYSGVAIAGLAAMMLDWPVRPLGLDIASYYLELARLPVQWVVVALLLGIYRQSQIRIDTERVREIAHLREVNDCIAKEVARLDEELWQFEVAAAVSPGVGAEHVNPVPAKSTTVEALVRLAALRTARPSEAGQRFAASAAAFFGDCGDIPVRLFRRTRSGSFAGVSRGRPLAGFGSEVHAEHPAVRGALDPEKIDLEALKATAVVVIALRPTPGADPCGLIVAECAGRSEMALAQTEGLRLLAAAATHALCAGDAPSMPGKRMRHVDG